MCFRSEHKLCQLESDKASAPQTALESDINCNFKGVLETAPSSANFLEGLVEPQRSCDIQGDGLLWRTGRDCNQPKKVVSGVPDSGFPLSSPRGVKDGVTSSQGWCVTHHAEANHAEYGQLGEIPWGLASRLFTTKVVSHVPPWLTVSLHPFLDVWLKHMRFCSSADWTPQQVDCPQTIMGPKSCNVQILLDRDTRGWQLCPNENEGPGWLETSSFVNGYHLSH